MTLAELEARRPAEVVAVRVDADEHRRLIELGVRRGARVEVLRRAPFGGPIAIRIGDSRLALRIDDARRVVVTRSGHGA